MIEQVAQRIQHVALLSELRTALQQMVKSDEERVSRHPHWGAVIPSLQRLLCGTDVRLEAFAAAWSLMYAAIVRLDHLQDGDPVDDPLPTNEQPSAQYNLLFSYYILATGLLDLLSPDHIPASRILRLRTFWTDTMLRMASGQQRDLTVNGPACDSPLEYYQQLAQAKTGATFALAFGGTAILLTDDTQTIDTLTLVGEMYGSLLQYSDDLLDETTQPNPTLTLPQALTLVRPAHASDNVHTPAGFGAYVYRAYHDKMIQALACLPVAVQQGILDLFDKAFGIHHNEARNSA
jgi:hypothetical protein